MSTLKPPSSARGHKRSPSDDRRQAAVLSPSSKGPLDEDSTTPEKTSTTMLSPSRSQPRDRSRSPLAPQQPSKVPGIDQVRHTITSMLCRPEIYRPLPPNLIPPAFLNSPYAPSPDTPLDDLVKRGHFHAAAITAARMLSNLNPATAELSTVFELFYTRLACLCLLNKATLELAALESLELRDLTASMYLDPVAGTHVAPWHLRVLAVRLQSLGFKDWRRGIMSYYILAHDARVQISRCTADEKEGTMWKGRLSDLGIRVASMLVEMGDLEAAARHLRTLATDGASEEERRKLKIMQAMVFLQIGDLRAAKRCLISMRSEDETLKSPTIEAMDPSSTNDYAEQVLQALLLTASGSPTSLQTWQTLAEQHPADDMIQQNFAIALLYAGKMPSAKTILERFVEEGSNVPHHAVLFNLSTLYELSGERSTLMKTHLADRLATGKTPGNGTWVRSVDNFKLDVGGGVVRV